MSESQVTIHIHEKAIKFLSAADIWTYVDEQRQEGGYMDEQTRSWVETWKNFEHLPLLKVVDDQTGEIFEFPTRESLPSSTLFNADGRPLLIIQNA